MRVLKANPNQAVRLGRKGENEATKIVFSKSYFSKFGTGEYRLIAQRNGDAAPYPVAITQDEDNIYWTVSDSDCGVWGHGRCELQLVNGDLLVKSVTYTTWTDEALPTEGELPEPYEDWVDDLYDTIDGKIAEADRAMDGKINTAQQAVTDAHAEYLLAKGQAELAASSANDAQRYAQTAHDEVQKFHVSISGKTMYVTASGEEE